MKLLLVFSFVLSSLSVLFAQEWVNFGDEPSASRYDDIYFIDDLTGWAVNGRGEIFKTTNGGLNWVMQYEADATYFRSCEFLDENVGFVGSLNGLFLRTDDGGESWTEIQDNVQDSLPGICGLAHAGDHVFGVGIFRYPAYFIKSTDRGITWTYTDMSQFADALVECHFIDENKGFLAGLKDDDGAIILRTLDGGTTWEEVFNSKLGTEYVWKLDFVSDQIAYGSIESFTQEPTRVTKTIDGGATWQMLEVSDNFLLDIQGIGFINENKGWVSPRNDRLYETIDGGLTWNRQEGTPGNINRMFRLSPNCIFASGSQIYKYDEPMSNVRREYELDLKHRVTLFPNPVADVLNITVAIHNSTFALLDVFTADGKRANQLFDGSISRGEHKFSLNVKHLLPGNYFVVLRTNEGFVSEELVVVESKK